MTRLTAADWRVIRAALAFYEADDLDDEAAYHGVDIDTWAAAVRATLAKVHERTDRRSSSRSTSPNISF